MPYIRDPEEMRAAIAQLTTAQQLWIDTEVADFNTKRPRLALLQILSDQMPLETSAVMVFDLLDSPEVTEFFIAQIMVNPAIAKVAHNMSYDQRFLGGKRAQNLHCTLTIAKSIPYYLLPVANYQLKTLIEYFQIVTVMDKAEQGSDWGQRPLSPEQLDYAALDVVYLAQLFPQLQTLHQHSYPEPAQEDLSALILRYRQLTHQWKTLDSERKNLEARLKQAMVAQSSTQLENRGLTGAIAPLRPKLGKRL
jgi:ribonuclease D